MPFIPCEKAPRIFMGRIVAPTGSEPGDGKYIMRLGHGDDAVRRQAGTASVLLGKYKLQPERSAYADAEGRLAALRDDVLKGVRKGDVRGALERVMDIRPFLSPETEERFPRVHTSSYDFRFDANYLAPDEPPTAGLILGQQRRRVFDPSSQSFYFTVSQVLESYLIAAALLRGEPSNLPVYPATAVISGEDGEEEHAPLLALVDPSGPEALTTFNLYRSHPLMESLELISDEAMWGVSNTMRAANRVRYLVAEMSMAMMKGDEYPLEDMHERFREIASSLYECHRIWPGCHFITEVFALIEESVKAPLAEDTMRSIQADWEGFAERFPRLAHNPQMLEAHVAAVTIETAERMAENARGFLAERIMEEEGPSPEGSRSGLN